MPRAIQFNNPAFRGVQAQQGTMYAPDEGEVFFTGGSNEKYGDRNFNSAVSYVKNGQIFTINPDKAFLNSQQGKYYQTKTALNELFGVNGVLGGNQSNQFSADPWTYIKRYAAQNGIADYKSAAAQNGGMALYDADLKKAQAQDLAFGESQVFNTLKSQLSSQDFNEFTNYYNQYKQGKPTGRFGLAREALDSYLQSKGYSHPTDGIAMKDAGYKAIQEELAKQGINVNLGSLAIYNPSDITSFGGLKTAGEGSYQDLYSAYNSRQQATGNIGAQTNIQGVGPGAATMDQAIAQGTATNYDASLGADKIAQLQAQDKATQAQAGTAPAYTQPTQTGQVQNPTYNAALAPTTPQTPLQQTINTQVQSNPQALANNAFINGVFKAYHGRDANAQELARYTNRTVGDSYNEIVGGAPTQQGAQDASLIAQGFDLIDNPAELERLSAMAGFDPSKIVKVDARMYAPPKLNVGTDGVFGSSDVTDPISSDLLKGAGKSDLNSDFLASTVNNYADQYNSQIPNSFTEIRNLFYKEVLNNKYRQELYAGLLERSQIDELSAQLTSIDKQIASRKQAWDTLAADVANTPISITAIQGRNAHIANMKNIEIEGLLGQRNAIAGDYDRAQKQLDNAYKIAEADYSQKVEGMKLFYEDAKELFNKQEQRTYEAKIKEEERKFELYKTELSQKMALIKDTPTAGITLNDSWDTISGKLVNMPKTEEYSLSFDPISGTAYRFNKANGEVQVINPNDFNFTNTQNPNNSFQLIQQGSGEAYQCGTWARSLGDYGNNTPMGDTLREKQSWVDRFGTQGTQGIGVGDLVITDGSDITGSPLKTGHALIVGSIDKQGNILAYEANATGNRAVTFGRQVNPNAIYGYVSGNMKDGQFQKMQSIAMAFDSSKQNQSTVNNIVKFIDKLPPKILDTVIQKADNFKDEIIVKDYLNVAPNYQLTQNIANTSTNPADSNSLIYAFAKTMDPGGRVTESDYDSATKIQSLFQKYGLQAKGIFSSTGVLTPEAKADLKEAIAAKFKVHEDSFNSLVDNYAQVRIAPYTTRYGGDVNSAKNWLLDYAKTYTGVTNSPTQKILVKHNATGEVGYIDENKFNSEIFTKQ